MSILLTSVIIFLCIVAAAFFSGAETALVCANRIRLRHLVERGNKRAVIVQGLLSKPQRFLGTTLVGTNLAIVGGSVVATKLAGHILGHSSNLAALAETAVMTVLVLIFAEIVPKNISRSHADVLVLLLAPLVRISYLTLSPIVAAASAFSHLLFRGQADPKGHQIPFVSREEMHYLTQESHRYGLIEKQEQFIVGQIFSFAETTVEEVMVPLEKMVAVDLDSTPVQVVESMRRRGLSRIPIYQNQRDHIVGAVDINHLLGARRNTPLRRLLYPLPSVPQDTSIEKLFLQLQGNREHMALVLDRKGRVRGIVTMEDLLEEIVGEIWDEHDEE